jgi:hypothetical protein
MRSIVENIEASSDLRRNEAVLYPSSWSRMVVILLTFHPMKYSGEKQIIVTHIPPVSLYARIHIVGSWIEPLLCLVHDSNGHRRYIT